MRRDGRARIDRAGVGRRHVRGDPPRKRSTDASPSEGTAAHLEPGEGAGGEGPDGEGPAVGDVVVIPYPRIRAQVGCGERAGVVLERRRGTVKAFFPDIDRAFWLDKSRVLSIAEDRLPLHPLARRLHRICRALRASLVEVYDREGDADVFHVFTRGTDLDSLTSVRDSLGPDFRSLTVDPGGVKKARVTLAFRTTVEPGPPSA
jgi:hypothetical protein